jgi:hypothetical protein
MELQCWYAEWLGVRSCRSWQLTVHPQQGKEPTDELTVHMYRTVGVNVGVSVGAWERGSEVRERWSELQ